MTQSWWLTTRVLACCAWAGGMICGAAWWRMHFPSREALPCVIGLFCLGQFVLMAGGLDPLFPHASRAATRCLKLGVLIVFIMAGVVGTWDVWVVSS